MSKTLYPYYDLEGNLIGEVPGVNVTCRTKDCENRGIEIEVPNIPDSDVMCGPCGAFLIRAEVVPE